LSIVFDPGTLAQKKSIPISGQTLKGIKVTVLAVTRMNEWRSKTPTESGEHLVIKAKEGQEIVVVRMKITVMKETDAIGFSPVNLHDAEGNKVGPLALFWKGGKFRRGHTMIEEILFKAPKGTGFKIFEAEDLQLNIEKLADEQD
jgi:hypothetical protein